MKLTKTEIMEYIVAFVGIVGLLAYIHATTVANPVVNALETSPMVIEPGRTIRADAGRPAAHFRGAT